MSYVVMSSLPSEAEARKILADERSGQAVMEDFLECEADALGFIGSLSRLESHSSIASASPSFAFTTRAS